MAFTGSFSSANMLTPRTAVLSSPSLQTKIRIGGLRAHLREDDDPLFLSGKEAASLRFMESQQPGMLNSHNYFCPTLHRTFGVHYNQRIVLCNRVYGIS